MMNKSMVRAMWSGVGRYAMRLDACYVDGKGQRKQIGVGLGFDHPAEFTTARFKAGLAALSRAAAERGAAGLFAPDHIDGLPKLTPEVQANFEAAFA
jgi:hypothetical protein